MRKLKAVARPSYKDPCVLTIRGSRSSLESAKAVLEAMDKHGAPGHSFDIFASCGGDRQLPKGGKSIHVEKYLGGFDGDGGERLECSEIMDDVDRKE